MKKILLLILTVFLSLTAVKAQEAYAVYTENDSILTFYYDNQKSSRSGTKYALNTGTNEPGWYTDHQADIKKAVFDSSFAEARPTSTYRWFALTNSIKVSILTEIVGIEYLNTSAVTNMGRMFSNCSGLKSLDVSHFNTSNVTNMEWMFHGCSGLTSLDVSHFDTSNVTIMSAMFAGCSGLTSLDVTHFDTSKVMTTYGMFSSCSGLTSLDVSHFNTSNVMDMDSMFQNCSSLTSLDVSHFNTSKVTHMNYMFSNCRGLTSLDVTHFDTSKVTDMSFMFRLCSGLTSLDVSHFNTSNVTNMRDMFSECSGLTSLDLSNFDTSNVTNMVYMFYGCSGLTSLDVSNFDTSEVRNMGWMFRDCSGLTSLDVTHFDTSNVTSMDYMFCFCSGLTSLDVSHFDTSKVTDMKWMFRDCSGLTSLDVSQFNTSNVTDMDHLFSGCRNLTTIYAGEGWNTDKVTTSSYMFRNCTNLVGGMGTKFDANHVDKAYAHIDGGASNPGYLTDKNATPQTQEAYAVYTNDGTLTFYYDTQKSSRSGTIYEMNTGDNDPGWYTDHQADIKKAVFDSSFAEARPTSTRYWFAVTNSFKVSILTEIVGIEYLNTSAVTNMEYMFYYCSGLTSLDVTHFDTSNVTNMSSMFSYCSGLTSLDVSNFDTSEVRNMGWMFRDCSGLTSLDLSNFDTSKVTDMGNMFCLCSGLTSLDVSHFDTSNVTSMSAMFAGCSGLTSLDVTHFDTSKVMTTYGMFSSCSGLTSIDVSHFDTSNVTSMSAMFSGCSGLTSIDVSHFDTSKVTNMGNMFSDCSGLTSLDVTHFDTSNVTNMEWMFCSCSGLTSLDVSHFDTSNVTSMSAMFSSCSGLTSLDVSHFDTSKVMTTYGMFNRCSGLTSLDLSNFDTSNVTNMRSMFGSCSGLTSLDVTHFNTSNVTDMGGMFNGCSGLTSLDVTHFDTSKVTDMVSMFGICSGLTSLDVTHLNTSKVTNMSSMFYGCSGLTSLDLSHFDTSNVTRMDNMFYGCSGLTSLDLSNFDTSNVTSMSWMFSNCSSLTTIYAGEGWNTDKVTSSSGMFRNCTNLVGGMGTKYDVNHVDKAYAHIDGGPSNPGYLTQESSDSDDEEPTGWNTLFDKKMLLIGSPRGEYMKLQSDGYLVWNNRADGDKTIKVYVDPNDNDMLLFDAYPDNYLKITGIEGNRASMVDENGLVRTFTIHDESEDMPITGNTFTAKSAEGVDMLFQIISESEKTCQVGNGSSTAISQNTAGIITIPIEAKGYRVIKIANRAFKECRQLTQIVIANTITEIGTTEFQSAMGAFHNCVGISSFDIPTSVILIGRGSFSGCTKITELKIPESVKVIGSNAFDHCRNLKSIELSPFITAILLETFRECYSLESIEIPGSVNSIGNNAFQGCNNLKTITSYIENPFTFPQSAFANYSAKLYVPAGTESIYRSTSCWNKFYDTEEYDDDANAYSFTTSKGLTYTVIGKTSTVSVKAASTGLSGDVMIPEVVMSNGKQYHVVTIKSNAFENCTGLQKLTISKTVTNIGAGAFIGCSSLTNLNVTNGSPYLSVDGVLYSEYMTRLVAFPAGRSGEYELPKSVTSLADGAFAGCSKLTALYATQNDPIVLKPGSGVFDGMDFEQCELHVPIGTGSKYRYAEGWKQFNHVIDDSEVNINGMIYSINEDGSLSLSGADDVLTIGDYVLPTEIEIDGVTYIITGIGDYAFEGCTGMTSLTIPETITSIGYHAFAGCTGLEEIYCLSPVPIDLESMFARILLCMRRSASEDGPNQFEGVDFENCILYVPVGTVELYRQAAGWSKFKHIVEMNGTDITEMEYSLANSSSNAAAYKLSGISLGNVSHKDHKQLPKGIYIISGKKIVVK